MSTKREGPTSTRLQRFLDKEGLTSAQLEEKAGISRESMRKIRRGKNVRQDTMGRILQAARILTGREVQIDELFDFDAREPGNHES